MKIVTKIFFSAISCVICFYSLSIQAQEIKPCGTTEMHLKLLQADPSYRKIFEQEQLRLAALDKTAFLDGYKTSRTSNSPDSAPKYIIPVVFHIIHKYGSENISDAQVRDAIRTLNEDFRKRNADTVNTVNEFKPIAADCEIEFRLAQLDPQGNPTNGIERIASRFTDSGTDSAKLNPWPREKYFNIWVVAYIRDGFAAFATYPGGPAAVDGVISLHTYIGAIGSSQLSHSHTLSHEVGHCFYLAHLWGNTNAPGINCGDDSVMDTPVTKGHNNVCPLNDQTCTTGVNENVNNFMEYSYCYTMFTNGQKARMHNTLNGTASGRNNLWTPANLVATGVSLPAKLSKADFLASATDVCQGTQITFTDNSWNGKPTSWNWEFEGGTPATSTDSIATIIYNTPGKYKVKLTVSNSTGTVSETKEDYITVTSIVADSVWFFQETFEYDSIPNAKWRIKSGAPVNPWVRTNLAAHTGVSSAMLLNPKNATLNVHELISYPLDMTKITGPNPVFAFYSSYAKRTTNSEDKLQIYVSSDCGKTWDIRLLINANTLANGRVETGNFIPNANQWEQRIIPLNAYRTRKNLIFKFRFTGVDGNNLFIDDINVTGSLGVNDEWLNRLNLNVYPNPATDHSVVAFNLESKDQITISVQDIVGRTVSTVFSGSLGAGRHEYSLMNTSLSKGIYLVNFVIGGHLLSKKLIVN